MSPLKQERINHGWPLRHITEQTGIALSYIHSLEEQRQFNPSLKVARSLSKLYGRSIEELFPEQEVLG